jgi:hypothetical protein
LVQQLGKAELTDQAEDENGKYRFWRRDVAMLERARLHR